MTNATEEEAMLRREMNKDVAEPRQDYELIIEQRVAVYEAELAEWKSQRKFWCKMDTRKEGCAITLHCAHTLPVFHTEGGEPETSHP